MATRKDSFYGVSQFQDFRIHAYRDSQTGECHVTGITIDDELLVPTRTFWVQLAELFGGDDIHFGGEYAFAHGATRLYGAERLVYRVTNDRWGNQLLSGVRLAANRGDGDFVEPWDIAESRFSVTEADNEEVDWPLFRQSTLEELLAGIDEIPLTRFAMYDEPPAGFVSSPVDWLRPSVN